MNKITFDSDKMMAVLGVPGRLTHRTRKPAQAPCLWFMQRWISVQRPIAGYGPGAKISVEIRFDDELGNRHNSFAITAEVTTPESLRRRDIAAGGCLHDDIAAVFPELEPLIKWHNVATDGPMHYVANTCYHASDRDHAGRKKGEPCAWEEHICFGDFPILYKVESRFLKWLQTHTGPLDIVEVAHQKTSGYQFSPKFSFDAFTQVWHECPFDSRRDAEEFRAAMALGWRTERIVTAYSEGKERNLAAARDCAVWPEATDEQLTAPRAELEAALMARLPELLSRFRAAVESIGFYWSPEDYPFGEERE